MHYRWPVVFLLIMFAGVSLAFTGIDRKTSPPPPADDATPFDVMMSVVTHKRCMNCHPSGDRPRQGEDSHLHNFNVQRGPDNHGVKGLQCATCHQKENNEYSGVPGAPHWGLAPLSMAWEGLSRTEIARSFLSRENNGGKSLEETVKHMTEDELVLWAFTPGVDDEGNMREVPPASEAAFVAAVKAWAAAGAVVPEK